MKRRTQAAAAITTRTTGNAVNNMANGLGRWLGLVADEDEMKEMQQQYNNTKAVEGVLALGRGGEWCAPRRYGHQMHERD